MQNRKKYFRNTQLKVYSSFFTLHSSFFLPLPQDITDKSTKHRTPMTTSDEEYEALASLGIPKTRISYADFEELLMKAPSDLPLALEQMQNKEVITIDGFKKEFKPFLGGVSTRQGQFRTVFTHHFIEQLRMVLAYFDAARGDNSFSNAVLECIFTEIRNISKAPIRNSHPTTHPKVRYVMPLAINFTFHLDLQALTLLTICT